MDVAAAAIARAGILFSGPGALPGSTLPVCATRAGSPTASLFPIQLRKTVLTTAALELALTWPRQPGQARPRSVCPFSPRLPEYFLVERWSVITLICSGSFPDSGSGTFVNPACDSRHISILRCRIAILLWKSRLLRHESAEPTRPGTRPEPVNPRPI